MSFIVSVKKMFSNLWDDSSVSRRRILYPRRAARFIMMVSRGVIRNDCGLHAAALTFSTLISIVPVLALVFSVSKGLGAGTRLQSTIDSYLAQMPEKVSEFIQNIFVYVERTNFAAIGAVGGLLLVWSVIKIMSSVEKSFNSIWYVRSPRTIYRKFTDYISVIVVVPLLLLASTSVSAVLANEKLLEMIRVWGGPFFYFYKRAIGLTGAASVVLAFTFLFMYMPNRKIRFTAALTGGFVSAVVWLGMQWVYIVFQVGVTKYNAIYGTFATVPIFFAWLYTSWFITLVGAEISHVCQDYDVLVPLYFRPADDIAQMRGMGIWIVCIVARQFVDKKGPCLESLLASRVKAAGMSVPTLNFVLARLIEGGIIAKTDGLRAAYVLCSPAEQINLYDIVSSVNPEGLFTARNGDRELCEQISALLSSAENSYSDSLKKTTIAGLISK